MMSRPNRVCRSFPQGHFGAFLLPFLNDLIQEGIGAGRVVGRVGKFQDSFVVTKGETWDLPKFRILQMLPQSAQIFFLAGLLFRSNFVF